MLSNISVNFAAIALSAAGFLAHFDAMAAGALQSNEPLSYAVVFSHQHTPDHSTP